MKVQLRQLTPNPFRNLPEYPIDKGKVKTLAKSIEATTFWDNILARPDPENVNKFQIAYGHHRLIALHQVFGTNSRHEIDIPIRELTDALMLKIMANENAKDWEMNTAVILETVKAARNFLKTHPKDEAVRSAPQEDRQVFSFLGDSCFSLAMIESALATLAAIEGINGHPAAVSEKAVKAIKEPTKAFEFVAAVKKAAAAGNPVPVKEQQKQAAHVRENLTSRQVAQHFQTIGYGGPRKEKEIPDISRRLQEDAASMKNLTIRGDQYLEFCSDLHGSEWALYKARAKTLMRTLNQLLNGGVNGRQKETPNRTGVRALLS
jgi:hypothetical protein